MFLFAVGYGVGPQFFRGISRDGPKQIVFSLIVLALCLIVPVVCAWFAGLNIGYAAGLYAGSQTISASIGVASDQIARLGLDAANAKAQADAIPIGYAVTYIFGTIGSAVLLAQLGPKLIGVDLAAACADYERRLGGGAAGFEPGAFSAYRAIVLRAYAIDAKSGLAGSPVRDLFPGPAHLRRARPPRRPDHRSRRRHRSAARRRGGDFGSASTARRARRGGRARGQRPGLARPAGGGARCVRHAQGDRRQDRSRAGGFPLRARRLPAPDHAQPRRDSGAAQGPKCCAATS